MRILPHPLLTIALLCMWLVLNNSVEFVHVFFGLLVGIAGGALHARLEPARPQVRRPLTAGAILLWELLRDIVRSNLAVLRITLGFGARGRVAGFLPIPLELRDPRGLAVLACIVTATPGTSWARYDAAGSVLTLHVLDLADEQAWVREFKDRYETRLMEIFP